MKPIRHCPDKLTPELPWKVVSTNKTLWLRSAVYKAKNINEQINQLRPMKCWTCWRYWNCIGKWYRRSAGIWSHCNTQDTDAVNDNNTWQQAFRSNLHQNCVFLQIIIWIMVQYFTPDVLPVAIVVSCFMSTLEVGGTGSRYGVASPYRSEPTNSWEWADFQIASDNSIYLLNGKL